MTDAVAIALSFISAIVTMIPTSPFMFLFGLVIVLVIADSIYKWVKGGA